MISAELSRIVFGSIKYARMDDTRNRANRLGMKRKNSRVLDDFPEGISAPVKPSEDEIVPGRRRKQRQILRDQIREIVRCPKSRELLKRVLLKGKSLPVVAAELGIEHSTARSIESRGRRALGLPPRRKTKNADDEK